MYTPGARHHPWTLEIPDLQLSALHSRPSCRYDTPEHCKSRC